MTKKIDCVVVGDIETNCWLYSPDDTPVKGKRPCIVIDPGEEAALIISRLGELNWIPEHIFLTHGHFDHLAALPDLRAAFKNEDGAFPMIGIHRLDAHYLGKDALAVHQHSMTAAGGSPAYVNALWKPMPEADLLFDEGSAAGPFRVLHLPGHTQGSIGFYDETAGVLFSGDTLFQGTWGRTDLPGGDEAQLYQSLKRILSMNEDTVICSGHGPATRIKDEKGLIRFLGA